MKEHARPMTLRDLAPDIASWPEEWMGTREDREYGKRLLPFMESFLNFLISEGLSAKLLKAHRDNVALLGRSIITRVSMYEEHGASPLATLHETVETGGLLPDGCDDMSEKELGAFERTCELFEKHLKKTY